MSPQRGRDPKMPASKRKQKAKVEPQVVSTLANAMEKAGVGASRNSTISEILPPSRQASASIDSINLPRQKLAKIRTKGKIRQTDAQVGLELKRQAQIKTKQTQTGAKNTSAKARKTLKGKAKSDDTSLFALGKVNTEQRVSFVVRVTIDERGQLRRTEVEHAHSGKKEIFPTLDVQRMAAFMIACIGSPSQSESISTSPSLAPIRTTQEFYKRAVSLNILDVKIFSAHSPGIMALTLDPDENFVVQARFQLQGSEALSLAADEFSFEMKVYANEVTSGTSKLLTTHSANVVKDVLEYTPQADAPGLSPGLYRLITAVTLHTPKKMAAHHARSIIHVAGI